MLDWDDNVEDTGELKSRILGKLGIHIPPERCSGDLAHGALSVLTYKWLRQAVANREFGLEAKPIYGAVHFIRQLAEEGHTLSVVTWRDGEALEVAEELAKRWGLPLTFHGVGYKKSKNPALSGQDVFMDDGLENLIAARGFVRHRFLFVREHNKNLPIPRGITPIPCWCTFYDRIQKLAKRPRNPPPKTFAACGAT